MASWTFQDTPDEAVKYLIQQEEKSKAAQEAAWGNLMTSIQATQHYDPVICSMANNLQTMAHLEQYPNLKWMAEEHKVPEEPETTSMPGPSRGPKAPRLQTPNPLSNADCGELNLRTDPTGRYVVNPYSTLILTIRKGMEPVGLFLRYKNPSMRNMVVPEQALQATVGGSPLNSSRTRIKNGSEGYNAKLLKIHSTPTNIKIKIKGMSHNLHNLGQVELVVFRPKQEDWPVPRSKSLKTLLSNRKKFPLHFVTNNHKHNVEIDLNQ